MKKQAIHKHNGWTISDAVSWKTNGISLGFATSTFESKSAYHTSNDRDCIRLHFGLSGDYSFTFKQIGKTFDLIGGHHNLIYSRGLDMEIRNKSAVIKTFGIEIPKDLFLKLKIGEESTFTAKILRGESCLYARKWGSINIPVQRSIDEIKTNPYSGSLQKIFLYAKTLELLVLCLEQYHKMDVKSSVLKNKMDKEKVIAARDYINANMTNPPNLSEVACKVGLNEFKLKNGFKEMFAQTPFSYLSERRLNLAKQFLKDTDKTASEIAFELGYSSPQHFNNRFKKAFGVTPKDIRNNP